MHKALGVGGVAVSNERKRDINGSGSWGLGGRIIIVLESFIFGEGRCWLINGWVGLLSSYSYHIISM